MLSHVSFFSKNIYNNSVCCVCSYLLKPKKMRWFLFLSLAVLSAGADDKETTNDLANETPSGNNINI